MNSARFLLYNFASGGSAGQKITGAADVVGASIWNSMDAWDLVYQCFRWTCSSCRGITYSTALRFWLSRFREKRCALPPSFVFLSGPRHSVSLRR